MGLAVSNIGSRARVSLDEEDWVVIVELVKLRFDDLIKAFQQASGDTRTKNRKAAGDLWEIIRDVEIQLPHHRRPNEASANILGPLREFRTAQMLMASLAPEAS